MEQKDANGDSYNDEIEKLKGKVVKLSVEIEKLNAENEKLNVVIGNLHVQIDGAESLYGFLGSDECTRKSLSEKLQNGAFLYEAIDPNASQITNIITLGAFLERKKDYLIANKDILMKNADIMEKNTDLLEKLKDRISTLSHPREFVVVLVY